MNIKLYLVIALAILAVIFVFQNVAVVEITFLFWSVRMSRSLLMILLLAIGIVIGWSVCGYISFRRKRASGQGKGPAV